MFPMLYIFLTMYALLQLLRLGICVLWSKKEETRRVLSETKAIMSPPVCHWMESNFFVEEGELIN